MMEGGTRVYGKHLTREERRLRRREAVTFAACLAVCFLLPCLVK